MVLGTGPARWLYGEDPVKSSAAGAAMELRFVWFNEERSSASSTEGRTLPWSLLGTFLQAAKQLRLDGGALSRTAAGAPRTAPTALQDTSTTRSPPPRARAGGALKLALDEIDGLDATLAPLELRGTTNSLACNEFSRLDGTLALECGDRLLFVCGYSSTAAAAEWHSSALDALAPSARRASLLQDASPTRPRRAPATARRRPSPTSSRAGLRSGAARASSSRRRGGLDPGEE